MYAPFGNRDFRRLFAGRVVTNIGDSFYFVAAMWMVYELSGSPFYSGVAGFLTLAPSALQFLAGPLVDRWSIRSTLTVTQLVQAVVVLAVPVAAYFGVLSVWVILVVMPLLSLMNQLVYPAQTTALPRLLDDEDLVAANSAFSLAYQGVDMVANAAGGILIALVGGVALFALDAITFLVAALLFVTVYVPPAPSTRETSPDADDERAPADAEPVSDGGKQAGENERESDDETPMSYLDQLREGASLMRGTFLMWLIAGAAVVNFAGGIALAAMPAYAELIGVTGVPPLLHGGGAYGVLMASFAAGNLFGAVGANVIDNRPFGLMMVVGFAWSALAWMLAIAVGWLPVTAVLLTVAFIPAGAINVQLAATIQSAVPDRLVGRVSSLLGSSTAASIPIGSLVGGSIGGVVGPTSAMWATGLAFGTLAVYTLAIPSLRGLPEITEIQLQAEPR